MGFYLSFCYITRLLSKMSSLTEFRSAAKHDILFKLTRLPPSQCPHLYPEFAGRGEGIVRASIEEEGKVEATSCRLNVEATSCRFVFLCGKMPHLQLCGKMPHLQLCGKMPHLQKKARPLQPGFDYLVICLVSFQV